MDQLKSGTLFVIVATVIAAILILTTSRHSNTSEVPKKEMVEVAVNEVKTSETNIAENKTEEIQNIAIDEIVENKEAVIEKETVAVIKDQQSPSDSENIENNDEVATLIAQTEPVEIKAPEGLFNNTPTDTANDDELKEEVSENQETENIIKPESIKPVATSTQHDLLNHLIQPIWMDQKLGDFKSVENGEIEFKLMPLTAEGIQGEDPKQVITNDNDKFAPTTVSADYNYQQMPMYNGGYYIAPMPQYLMDSVLPSSSKNTDK